MPGGIVKRIPVPSSTAPNAAFKVVTRMFFTSCPATEVSFAASSILSMVYLHGVLGEATQ